MQIILLYLIVFIVSIFNSVAQNTKDSIITNRIAGGVYEYYQKCECKRLSMDDLEKIVSANNEALKLIQSTQINGTISDYSKIIGGCLILDQIFKVLYTEKINWTMAGIGAGFIAISIPLNNKYNNDVNKAVDIYNGKLLSDNFWDKSELKLTVNANSIGFVLNF